MMMKGFSETSKTAFIPAYTPSQVVAVSFLFFSSRRSIERVRQEDLTHSEMSTRSKIARAASSLLCNGKRRGGTRRGDLYDGYDGKKIYKNQLLKTKLCVISEEEAPTEEETLHNTSEQSPQADCSSSRCFTDKPRKNPFRFQWWKMRSSTTKEAVVRNCEEVEPQATGVVANFTTTMKEEENKTTHKNITSASTVKRGSARRQQEAAQRRAAQDEKRRKRYQKWLLEMHYQVLGEQWERTQVRHRQQQRRQYW